MRMFSSTGLLLELLQAQGPSREPPARAVQPPRRRSTGDSAPFTAPKAEPKGRRRQALVQAVAP